MPIEVRHDQGPASLGGIAAAIGQGQAATRNAALDEDRARFLLGLRENQKQFDVNTALRLRGQDIEQRQYNTNLAIQDSRQQQLNQNAELNRQAQLQSQAMREESDVYQQQQAQQFAYQAQAAKSLDEQVFETEKAAQQLKLNPEGQRILNEKIGSLRKVKEARALARPDVYANLLGQWMSDYEQANLSAYEVQEPTAQQKVYDGLVPLQGQQIVPGQPLPPGTYRSLKGTRNGVESWETLTIPPADPATIAERVQRDSAPAPDGGIILWNPDKQAYTHIPPAKPEKAAEAKPVDTSKYLKEAASQLRAEHQISQAGSLSPTPFKMDLTAAKARARELMQAEKDLEAELATEAAPDELGGESAGEPLLKGLPDLFNAKRPQTMEEVAAVQPGEVFFWNGQYAEMNDDGTVTVIE